MNGMSESERSVSLLGLLHRVLSDVGGARSKLASGLREFGLKQYDCGLRSPLLQLVKPYLSGQPGLGHRHADGG